MIVKGRVSAIGAPADGIEAITHVLSGWPAGFTLGAGS
jgi:chemotaxis response regulator CheB